MKRILLGIIPMLLFLAACGGQGSQGTGQARVMLTDAPATLADTLPVTFSQVELVGEAEGRAVIAVEPQTIDVLTLRNGGLEMLGEAELPAGTYEQLRLIVDDAKIGFGGGAEVHDVTVPSGAQTGLKINIEPALVVAAGQTSEVVLDFDAGRAVIENPPGSGNYILKPTAIRAVATSGTVEGNVSAGGGAAGEPQVPLAGVLVVVYDQGGNEVTSTVTEADGSFRLITLVPGTYDFQLSLEGYGSLLVEDVVVAEGEVLVLTDLELSATAP